MVSARLDSVLFTRTLDVQQHRFAFGGLLRRWPWVSCVIPIAFLGRRGMAWGHVPCGAGAGCISPLVGWLRLCRFMGGVVCINYSCSVFAWLCHRGC